MRDALASYLPNSSRMPTFGGSSYWVTGPQGLDSDALGLEALEAGLIIEPGAIYFAGEQAASSYFRLGFSSIDSKQIAPGIKLLSELIDVHMAKKPCAPER